jgi:vanillate O-demethylase ferredoxin subunit
MRRPVEQISEISSSPELVGRTQVLVRRIKQEAEEIVSLELVDPSGRPLPSATAGSHIEVHLPNSLVRQYSLCNAPANDESYEVAVLREKTSRGGSDAMHRLKPGDIISISGPRNNFALAGVEANHHLLIAGGIGITPMMAMIYELQSRAAVFHLHYCARNPAKAPFLDRLQPFIDQGSVSVHYDDGDPGRSFNIHAALATPIPAQHVYVCGPPGLMTAAREAVGAWAPHTVHFEQFSGGPISMEEDEWEDIPFEVVVKSSGKRVLVPGSCSITSALRAVGVEVPTSCEAGFCGACLTRYLEGDPVHRDTVLSQAERRNYALICRARSRTADLVLDL